MEDTQITDLNAEYDAQISEVVAAISADPQKYRNLDLDRFIADLELTAGHPATARLEFPLSAHPINIKPDKFRAALKRYEKTQKVDSDAQAHAVLLAPIGGVPRSARTFVEAMFAWRGYTMTFDGDFISRDGTVIAAEQVANDLHITAGEMKLTPPSGKVLNSKNIDRAMEDYISAARAAAKDAVIDRMRCADPILAQQTMVHFRHVCEVFFHDGGFAFAAFAKFMWQVKRKLLGMPITLHHMIVLQGAQGSGKTEMVRKLCKPFEEIYAESDVSQLADDKNFDMREHYIVFTDEMAKAGGVSRDGGDLAKLKNIITGATNKTRIHRSHNMHKQAMNMTCIGTSNKKLGEVVYDTSGMRRFIEIDMRPKAQTDGNWNLVADFPFLDLWQAIDPAAEDPLTPYKAQVERMQEGMRARSNVEHWLEEFELNIALKRDAPLAGGWFEFKARQLFDGSFTNYEKSYHPSSHGTSLPIFGKQLTAAIDSGHYPEWRKRIVGKTTLYSFTDPAPARQPQHEVVIALAG